MFDVITGSIVVAAAAGTVGGYLVGRWSAPAKTGTEWDLKYLAELERLENEIEDLIDGSYGSTFPIDDPFTAEIEAANPVRGVENPDYVLLGRAIDLVKTRSVPNNTRNLELAFMVAWLIQMLTPEGRASVLRKIESVEDAEM